jgi:glutathione S-transferase
MAYDLSLEFFLSAAPEKVMRLLTDAKLIRRWSGGEAVVENKEGGRFEMFDGWATGTVLKAGKHELSYTWKTTEWPEGAKPGEVHFLLKAENGGTKVTVRHTGFPDEEEMKSHHSGWTDYFFDPLEDYIMIFEQK